MIASIYHSFDHHLPRSIDIAVKHTIEEGLAAHGQVKLFFRADDIGVPSKNYSRMMALFLKYRIPLCLAVVPAWLTRQRWESMARFRKKGGDLFCWHMHGYRHMNHEKEGKKFEFGPGRSSRKLYDDLSQGSARLQSIIGEGLTPVFTPPWNRCTSGTMDILKQIGFKAVSRSHGSLPLPPPGLKDFPVHVDLHTRKEKQAGKGWEKLVKELSKGMESKTCGIMIHHMRMNNQAFIFLEYLLERFAGYEQIKTVTYKDLE